MTLRTLFSLAIFGLLVALSACRQMEETQNPVSQTMEELGTTSSYDLSSDSEELARIQFDDIPSLRELHFRNHRNESYSYSLGDFRRGRFVYWGQVEHPDILKRYLEIMPKDPYNWRLVGEPASEIWNSLHFVKTGSKCEISFSRTRPDPKTGLVITITVESTQEHE